ncbi:hypothetical protein [Niallia sp. NCCP-28]
MCQKGDHFLLLSIVGEYTIKGTSELIVSYI